MARHNHAERTASPADLELNEEQLRDEAGAGAGAGAAATIHAGKLQLRLSDWARTDALDLFKRDELLNKIGFISAGLFGRATTSAMPGRISLAMPPLMERSRRLRDRERQAEPYPEPTKKAGAEVK